MAIDVKGTLYWETGLPADQSGRVEAAVLKYTNGKTTDSILTNDDGDFWIPDLDESKELSVVLLHEGGRPSTVAFKAGKFKGPLELRIMPIEGPRAPRVGIFMLALFSLLLILLTAVYLSAHQTTVSQANQKYAALIEALETVPTRLESATPDGLSTSQDEVRTAKLAVDELRTTLDVELDALVIEIISYRRTADTEDLDDLERLVERAVDGLRRPVDRFFWNTWPWRMVEIWAWGLFGVLLAKITRIGWYVRSSTYQANGTWMHLAHVVATPFLALVAVLVLSLLKIEGESQTIVDFSNPLLMVVAACLLSTNPWGLWDFVLSRGDALISKAGATTN